MPFTKTKNEEKTLSQVLGISDERTKEIIRFVRKIVVSVNNNEQNLKHLYARFDDMELMFATYAYGRMVEQCSVGGEDVPNEIIGFLKGFSEFLDRKSK